MRQGVHSADANVRRLSEIMQPSLFTGYYPAGTVVDKKNVAFVTLNFISFGKISLCIFANPF